MQKPSLRMKETTIEQPVSDDTKRPKNPSANILPTEGYALEIDGKFKSDYGTSEEVLRAGLELKKKFPLIQVKVYSAKERTRTLVELPEEEQKQTKASPA